MFLCVKLATGTQICIEQKVVNHIYIYIYIWAKCSENFAFVNNLGQIKETP